MCPSQTHVLWTSFVCSWGLHRRCMCVEELPSASGSFSWSRTTCSAHLHPPRGARSQEIRSLQRNVEPPPELGGVHVSGETQVVCCVLLLCHSEASSRNTLFQKNNPSLNYLSTAPTVTHSHDMIQHVPETCRIHGSSPGTFPRASPGSASASGRNNDKGKSQSAVLGFELCWLTFWSNYMFVLNLLFGRENIHIVKLKTFSFFSLKVKTRQSPCSRGWNLKLLQFFDVDQLM